MKLILGLIILMSMLGANFMTKYCSIFILFILIGLFTSCSNSSGKNKTLKNYFTNSEIVELNRLVDFVRTQLIKDCDSDETECLYKYFKKFKDLGANDTPNFHFDTFEQRRIIASLSPDLFNKIWRYCEGTRSVDKDCRVETRSLCLNSKGRFVDFIIASTTDNPNLAPYQKPIKELRFYSPATNGILLWMPEKFNLESDTEMLLITIHLLTISHPVELK